MQSIIECTAASGCRCKCQLLQRLVLQRKGSEGSSCNDLAIDGGDLRRRQMCVVDGQVGNSASVEAVGVEVRACAKRDGLVCWDEQRITSGDVDRGTLRICDPKMTACGTSATTWPLKMTAYR